MIADEELHHHAVENLNQADALLFGRVTYEMMEAAFRSPARTGAMPDWMEPFARTIDAKKKYDVSSTRDRADWNAELVHGDLGKAVQQLKREPGMGLFVRGVKLPLALAELGLIDEYEFVVQPRLAGHRPTLFAVLSKHVGFKLVSRLEFGSGRWRCGMSREGSRKASSDDAGDSLTCACSGLAHRLRRSRGRVRAL
jgi:dihydrofolate reductase